MTPCPEDSDFVLLTRRAMGTLFDLALYDGDPIQMRAAGELAFEEIARLEAQLSIYRASSDISRINRAAGGAPVRVEPRLFQLLQRIDAVHAQTHGAFDPTTGPLVRVWGFHGGPGHEPDPGALAEANALVGWRRVELDPKTRSVRLPCPGMLLDLGSIGKGYALDCAAEILREEGVAAGLIHGGASTIVVWGNRRQHPPWKVYLPTDPSQSARIPTSEAPPIGDPSSQGIAVPLNDESLSMSAIWGRAIRQGDRLLGHVIDPRTGWPVQRTHSAAVALPTATDSDAWATALLVLGDEGRDCLQEHHPGARCWVQ